MPAFISAIRKPAGPVQVPVHNHSHLYVDQLYMYSSVSDKLVGVSVARGSTEAMHCLGACNNYKCGNEF